MNKVVSIADTYSNILKTVKKEILIGDIFFHWMNISELAKFELWRYFVCPNL